MSRTKWNWEQVEGYLRMKNIPKQAIMQIREVLANDAIEQGNNIQYDRIYTAVALGFYKWLHEMAQLEGKKQVFTKRFIDRLDDIEQKETVRFCHMFDDICGSVTDEAGWPGIMEECDKKLGIVFRNGTEESRVIMEYIGPYEQERREADTILKE